MLAWASKIWRPTLRIDRNVLEAKIGSGDLNDEEVLVRVRYRLARFTAPLAIETLIFRTRHFDVSRQ